MNNERNIGIYYKILNLEVDDNWKQCKKKYRVAVNLWHPDKFSSNNSKTEIAEEKIKEINIAYNFLSNYYKKHKVMPRTGFNEAIDQGQQNKFDVSSLYSELNINKKVIQKKFFSNKSIYIAVITLSVFILIKSINTPTTESTQLKNHDALIATQQKKYPTYIINSPPSKITSYFMIGSSIEEVLEYQGTPTRTVAGKWYYNKSWILIENGRVSNWFNDKNYPLNVESKISNEIKQFSIVKSAYNFSKGSTKNNVLRIQGKPIRKTRNIWYYGLSKVYFKNNKVTSWFNSPLNPLHVSK